MEWILLGSVALAILYLIVTYNRLVTLQQRAIQAFANIDVQLRERHDLVPKLVETVKEYAAHERGTFEAVMAAHNAASSAHGPTQQAAAEAELNHGLDRLFALAKSCPEIKASEEFLSLQGEMSTIEDKLAAARRFFNNAVSEFNAAVRSFPAVLFAGALGFIPREPFDIGETQRNALEVAPQVKF